MTPATKEELVGMFWGVVAILAGLSILVFSLTNNPGWQP